jgi:lipoprotein-anchoring transpeptidase ErfK/SrfK
MPARRVGALVAVLIVSLVAIPAGYAGPDDGRAPSKATANPPVAGPNRIVDGVSIAGLLVGGMTVAEARELVNAEFAKPIVLQMSPTQKFRFTPTQLGAVANVKKAVGIAARARRLGLYVPLDVAVPSGRLERVLAGLGRKTHVDPVDAKLRFDGVQPVVTKDTPGRRLKEVMAARDIRRALKIHSRAPIQLRFDEVKAGSTASDLRSVIVIRRESKKLHYYVGGKLKRVFGVATGLPSFPTPLGRFEIVTKQRNPWWYPPPGSEWAQGKEAVPPGPGNPLGTRWMGISSPYVGIHGTPDAASIGYSASHGCVRMLISQAEWLFERVEVGTPVYIVRA